MARRRSLGFIGGLGSPLTRISLIALIIIAVILLVVDRSRPDQSPFLPLKPIAADQAGPVMNVLSAPLRTLNNISEGVAAHWQAAARVRELEQENRNLLQWRDLALAMHEKMARYEELLKAPKAPTPLVVTARAITDSGGPFVRARLINAGSENGIAEGQAVLAPNGLIGRVMSAGKHTARVLLLTDLNSRIPVFIGETGAHAILAGDNSAAPRLVYIGRDVQIEAGMRIMTSGEDGVLPRGLSIGRVVKTRGGAWRVLLNARPEQIDFVSVLQIPPVVFEENEDPALVADGAPPSPDAEADTAASQNGTVPPTEGALATTLPGATLPAEDL